MEVGEGRLVVLCTRERFYEEKTFAPPTMESTGPSEGNLQNQRSREQRSVGQDRSSKLGLGTSSSL